MKVKLNLKHNQTYLLACSYGPDSMFLFHHLLKKKANFIVCHVNYHKRPESNQEEESLKKFCKDHNVLFEVLDTSKMKCSGNFQAWARDVRYDFFKKCYDKYKASVLLVAHQQDDVIETYCIQKRRMAFVHAWGIATYSKVNGMNVYRPLLNLSKKEIQEFNDKNSVPYAIDSSNLKDDYERNSLRHHYVSQISMEERQKLIDEIAKENKALNDIKNKVSPLISSQNKLSVEAAKSLSFEEFAQALFIILDNEGIDSPISLKQIRDFMNNLISAKSNIAIPLGNDVTYYQEYGDICIRKEAKPYIYTIESPTMLDVDEFYIDLSFGGEDRNIHQDDYPIYIRSPKENDTYKIKNYEASINRLFIDWKMPPHLRKVWPVIENKDGKIIYIPRYKKEYVDNHKTPFKIKLN
ncbi:MAG: tRNA lysidine(34) synthetase TilS [Bacilli bacterium]|nr:tRNA lysidine(34) synthetase TilS [Bacilli bacterium]